MSKLHSSARRRGLAALSGLALTIGLISIAAPAATAVIPTPPAPACSTTVVPGLPLIHGRPDEPTVDAPASYLTATDSHGLWAGARYNGSRTFQVVAWRNGVTQVLDTFSYTDWNSYATVTVAGISSTGAVVANVEDPNNPSRNLMYRYQNGHRYDYGRNGSWLYPYATGVSPDGHVVGYVRNAASQYLVAEWDAYGSATTIVDGEVSNPLIDEFDDVIWTYYPPKVEGGTYFRTPSGRHGQLLPGSAPNSYVSLSAGRWVFAQTEGAHGLGVQIWDMTQAASSNALLPTPTPTGGFSYLSASGPDRSYIASDHGNSPYHFAFFDAYGDGHRLPTDGAGPAGYFAIAADGTFSWLGVDGLTRFTHCPLNYAKHNPRGVIYHGAVVNGQTLITGGSFDSDDATGHDLVYIFDQSTPTRRLLATVTADQYDPAFSSAYGISGNHRYRYTLPAVHGRHTYCAYGRNVGYGNQNTLLGCTTVTA